MRTTHLIRVVTFAYSYKKEDLDEAHGGTMCICALAKIFRRLAHNPFVGVECIMALKSCDCHMMREEGLRRGIYGIRRMPINPRLMFIVLTISPTVHGVTNLR